MLHLLSVPLFMNIQNYHSLDMNKIRCIAVDDEPPALEVLKNYISSVAMLELAGTCNNAVEAVNLLGQKEVDLMFLDIQMPMLLGTDLVRSLSKPPRIIFTTAYRKFAIEGFELNAVDYLLKPVSFERFLKAVSKVMNVAISPNQTVPESKAQVNDQYIYFRADRKMYKVALDEIIYIESMKDYIKVVTTGRNIITKQSISSLEESLPSSLFVRIHRSYIVAIKKIQSYTSELVAVGKEELPVSRMYKYEVDKALK
jgi:DNA-binding LytR/AlgR family response regulator